MSLHSRTDYTKGVLNQSSLDEGPWALLEQWVKEAVEAGISDPTAFTLTTMDGVGFPHGRIVLLRDTRDGELVFYTNYLSEKGRDLAREPRAGATFFWPHAERQIRVRGHVTQVSSEESDAYFASRPRASQLGAWASLQSTSIDSRDGLERQYAEQEIKFKGKEIQRPPHWGGFALKPQVIEFWQGRASRMHDRLVCRRNGSEGWIVERIQP